MLLLLRARGDVTTPTSLQASVSLWVTPGCEFEFEFPAKLLSEEEAGGGLEEASPKLRATLMGLWPNIPDTTDPVAAVPA